MARDGEIIQRQHFLSSCFQAELFSRFLPSSYAGHVNLAGEKPSLFMLNCKYGSPVEIIVFRVQYFFSA